MFSVGLMLRVKPVGKRLTSLKRYGETNVFTLKESVNYLKLRVCGYFKFHFMSLLITFRSWNLPFKFYFNSARYNFTIVLNL